MHQFGHGTSRHECDSYSRVHHFGHDSIIRELANKLAKTLRLVSFCKRRLNKLSLSIPIAVCPIRFNRNSLPVDTSVTTLDFTEDELDLFAVITGTRRRLVRGSTDLNLSPNSDCTIDSLEILHGPSWTGLSKTGFILERSGQGLYLTVSELVQWVGLWYSEHSGMIVTMRFLCDYSM